MKAVQIKICGVTNIEDALACADAGANAVGLVFYPPSPRFVTDTAASQICQALLPRVCPVGVFVNEDFDAVMARVRACGLRAVQLHGQESPELVERLKGTGVAVIKALFLNKAPFFKDAARYPADALLVEYAFGPLPGGNAATWDWALARDLSGARPLVLAGGLNAANVAQAVAQAMPDAVDASSSVESVPGKKDHQRIREFIAAASACRQNGVTRRVFA